jgi:cytochrome P450
VYPSASVWTLRRARDNPIAFLEQLASHGDLVTFSIAGHAACLLNHPDYVEDVLVTSHAAFTKPPGMRRSGALLGRGLLTAEGELHQQRRKVALPVFSPQRLEGYAAVISAAAARAADEWQDGATIDMAAAMQGLTMEIIGRLLFGADISAHAAEVRRAMTSAAASLDPLLALLAPARRLSSASRYLRSLVDRLIDERCTGPGGGDMLTMLRRAEGSEHESPGAQLRDDVATLFVAGHDTIANALVWTWHLLGQTPAAEARLQDELRDAIGWRPAEFGDLDRLAWTRAILAEALRMYPPAWVLTRQARVDHQVGGVTIPAGTVVLVSQYLLHRDRRFFPDPLEFRPERWLDGSQAGRPKLAYFPFGAGPRSCIGQGLALVEGPLVLATLAARWRCRPLVPVDADPRATLRPRGPVPMRIERVD